jgi:hypothetical protein
MKNLHLGASISSSKAQTQHVSHLNLKTGCRVIGFQSDRFASRAFYISSLYSASLSPYTYVIRKRLFEFKRETIIKQQQNFGILYFLVSFVVFMRAEVQYI